MGLKGNEYYLLRSKDGRDKEYTPESLAKKANEYFLWCIENPLYESVLHQKTAELIEVPKMRVFSIRGFCNYADICEKTFWNYSKANEFLQVTTRIRQIIDSQKFEGATSGFFNSNIIARDLGLVEKTDNTNNNINYNSEPLSAEDIKKTSDKLEDEY